MATEIGFAAKTGQIDKAAQLIAHAALGCATGAIAAGDCMGRAAGAAAGEATALLMLENWTRTTLVKLKAGEISDAELAEEYATLRNRGINIAALTGGLTALLIGSEVGTGAMAGGNAAQNNALPILPIIGIFALLEALDKALLVNDGINLGRALDACNAGDLAACGQAEQIRDQLVMDGAVELMIGSILPGSKIATDLGRWVRNSGDAGRTVTEFVDGVTVFDTRTGTTFTGTVDLRPTLDRIETGGSFSHSRDGSIFQNRPVPGKTQPELPVQPQGYYIEYVHPTPGVSGPGPQRIVIGAGGEIYYTPDHYATFIRLDR